LELLMRLLATSTEPATSTKLRPDVLDLPALTTYPGGPDTGRRPWFARRRPLRRLDAPVIAVLRDRLDDVTVARCAGQRARRERRHLVLVIPLPARTVSAGDNADAIAARVRPELDRLGLSARSAVVWYDDTADARRRERRALAAVDRLARRLRAEVVVTAAPSLSLSPQPETAPANDRHPTARDVDELPSATAR
jgi:hypothetical protein